MQSANRQQMIFKQAISEQRLPVKAHFNLLAWTDNKDELKTIRNLCSSALTQMDATPKLEAEGSGTDILGWYSR